ncbi:translation initiation factor eIF2B subunit beta-like [Bolinopsis microptera]
MDSYLINKVPKETLVQLEEFSAYLKDHRKTRTSYASVIKTINILKELICASDWVTAGELIKIIKTYSKYLPLILSNETVVSNVIRRVLKIIREENEGPDAASFAEGLAIFFRSDSQSSTIGRKDLQDNILNSIVELLAEQENSKSNIITMALEHIHANELILTYGHSNTVREFLLHGRKKRNFRVVVCESGPSLKGHQMAKELSDGGIETTLIADSAAFAIIHAVNKVIIGTHTIMADGALRAPNGAHQLTLAAEHFSVPVIVCAALYKLSPTHLCSYDQDAFNKIIGPENMLNFSNTKLHSKVLVSNPEFDYVPSDMIELFITNTGGHAPSYLYRIVSELYHPHDNDLDNMCVEESDDEH